ncbi:MAG: hypothetical protein KGZ93_03815 [Actinobacteria bacterium]|nr:hypothetical protein [Actinomycetota bacterium]
MAFNWSEYLALAQELPKKSSSSGNMEAKLRSAISRAYYAAYCKSRNHMQHKDMKSFPSYKVNKHDFVKQHFLNDTDKARKSIGANLDRLREERNKADYDNSFKGNLLNTTQKSISQTQKLFSKLSSL